MKNTPSLGPTPVRPPAAVPDEATEPARRRLLELLARRGGDPATVGELAESVDAHQNTTRHHLRALSEAELVEAVALPSDGRRGRPSTGWRLTARGEEVAGGPASAVGEYVALAAAFAERLADGSGDPGADARAIGRTWGAGLADRRRAKRVGAVGALTELLGTLGFSPERAGADDSTLLVRTCPLLDAARRHPEVVCQVHLGMAAGALQEFGMNSAELRLEPFAAPGVCRFELPAGRGIDDCCRSDLA